MCTEPLSEFVWRVTLMQDGLANSTCAAKERIEKKCNAFQKRPQVVKVLWQGSMLQFHFRATKTLKQWAYLPHYLPVCMLTLLER
eukprot:scaffold124031_cov20-Tisochrysis_lutea.AAC.1